MKKIIMSAIIAGTLLFSSASGALGETSDLVMENLKIVRGETVSLAEKTTTFQSAGQWIQASDGRWWYRHSDGSYTVNNWEHIGGQWYYFDGNGWMVTGWLNLGGTWYYLSASGAMATGWQAINGHWYYLKSDGAMVTGWYHVSYAGQYGGKPYWNYFDSSGAYVTDSDTKGCIHGKNTYVDHKCIYSGNLKYCISTTKKSENSINTAASYWNALGNCHASFKQLGISGKSHINITSSKNFETTTLAITYFFYNGNTTKPQNTNWSGCQIDLNENKSTTIATIAHEFGHTLGLSHRISKKDSIMCQQGQGRTATKPNSTEVSVVNHLY